MVYVIVRLILYSLLLIITFSVPLSAVPAADKFTYLLTQLVSKDNEKAAEAFNLLMNSFDPRAFAVLKLGLSQKNPDIRRECANILGWRKDPGAAAALLSLVHDPDIKMRRTCILAIGQLGDPGSRELMVGLITDPEPGVRSAAVFALSRIGGDMGDLLLITLMDPDPGVRLAAIRGFRTLKDPRAVAPLAAIARGPDMKQREAAIETLGYLGTPAIDSLMRLLSSVEVKVRRQAVSALAAIEDSRARAAVRAAWADNSADVRTLVLSALAHFGDAESREALCAALNDPDGNIRDLVLSYLSSLALNPDTHELPLVLPLLEDPDQNVRMRAASLLEEVRDPQLVEPLLARLVQPDYSPYIITALGTQRDPRTVPALIALLPAIDPSYQEDTHGAMREGEFGDDELFYYGYHSTPASLASEALIAIGTPAVDALLAAMQSENQRLRVRTTLTLGEIADPRTLHALLQALKDGDIKVRRAVVMALGRLGDARGYEALIALLDEKDKDLRSEIIQALSDSRDPRLIPLFTKMAQSRNEWERGLAVSALGEMDDPRVVPVMLRALRDRSDDVRYDATYCSGWLTDPRAADGLVGVLGDRDDNVRRNAKDQLRDMDTAVVAPALVQGLCSPNPLVREGAADAASSHRDFRLVAPLLQALMDRSQAVRSQAAYALVEFHEPSIRPRVERLLADMPYLDTREECIRLLGSIRAADLLLPMLTAPIRPEERKAILSALAETGDPRALEPLAAAIDDPDPDTRYYAIRGLSRIKDDRAIQALFRIVREGNASKAGIALAALYEAHIPVDAELLKPFISETSIDGNAILLAGRQQERWAADSMMELLARRLRYVGHYLNSRLASEPLIIALGDLRETRAVELITVALADDDLPAIAAEALGKIGGTRAAEALLASLSDRHDYEGGFLRIAGEALGGIKDGRERERLTEAATSGSWRIRCGAVYALGDTSEPWAIPPALTALADPQPQIRAAAAEALGRLKAKEAGSELTKALTDPYPEVRAAAKKALAAIGE